MNPVDDAVSRWLLSVRTGWLDAVVVGVTQLGSSAVLVPLLLAVGLGLGVRRGAWSPLALLGGTWIAAVASYTTLKLVVGRPRPDVAPLVDAGGLAFPSGHATQAAVAWLSLAFVTVVWRSGPQPSAPWPGRPSPARGARAWPVYTAAAVVIALVAASRPYLGVHWFTDVLAGTALGAAWALVLIRLAGDAVRRELAAPVTPAR